MTSAKKIRVLLLEADTRQSLPLAKALRRLGHYVTVLCESRVSFGSWSRYPHRRIFGPSCCHEPESYLEFLVDFLRSYRQDVVIPLFDYSATLLSRFKPELSQYTNIPVADYDVFMLARDKRHTMRMCARHGVAHPATHDPETESLASIVSQVQFPCLIKPNIGHGAIGIRRVNVPGELAEAYEEVKRQYGPCCVQEYIPQGALQYKAQLFRGKDGQIHAAVVFSKIRYFPVTGGTSSLNCTVSRPDIVATCCQLLEAMDWASYADVDLIEDPRDGRPKVIEINPRVTGSIKIAFEAGVDFADLLVRYALGDEPPTYERYRIGLQMRYMPLDILWLLYSPSRWRARPSWFKFWGRDLCYQEGSWDDPLPAVAGFVCGVRKFLQPEFRRGKFG